MNDHRYSAPSIALSAAVAALLGACVVAHANADAPDTDGDASRNPSGRQDAMQEITIEGQRSTLTMAIAAQREAPNLINLTTAEEMQKLPDVNTGEAIRRVPGIALETDTGEGRYINIRGLDADLNSTTFGGLRLPPTNNSSPSGAGRAVAFDSIPIGFVGAIKVTKSNLPEQDAEALGGTIDITPKTAPADGRPFADIKLGSGYELERHTSIIDASGTAGTRFGGGSSGYQPFSILVVASTYDDRRGIDDAEAGFIDNQPTTPDKAFSGFEQRYYRYHRERHGYGADLGFAPDEANKYFIRYYDAGYSETVDRNRLVWNLTGAPSIDPANPNGFVDTAGFKKSLRDEKEYLDSKVGEIGGQNLFGANTLDYHVGYTKGSYYKPYDYNSTFKNPALANVSYDNTTRPNWPVVNVLPGTASNGTTTINPSNPAGYVLSGLNSSSVHSDDHEWSIGANLTLPTHLTDRSDEAFKFGINARIRGKTADQTSISYTNLPALPLDSAVYGSNVTFYQHHYSNGPEINGQTLRGVAAAAAAAGNVSGDPVGNDLANVNDKEKVYAAYGQYQFGYGALGVVAGARVENTRATYGGNRSDNTGSVASAGCPVIDPGPPAVHVCAVATGRTYTNFFPTAQARYEFAPDLIGRLAISSTIARPGFQQVTTATTVDAGSGNITTGNPNLKPTTATGLDIDIEKYSEHDGLATFGFFAKNIRDYIVTDVQQTLGGPEVSGGNLGLLKLISYQNAPSTHLYGIEANVVQHFRELPGALAGLGASANWTWVQSKLDVPVVGSTGLSTTSRVAALQSLSRHTVNAELLYEMSGLNLTLGAYYASRNLWAYGNLPTLDQWVQDRVSLDFGSQYKVSEPLSFYLNVKNLTNTPLKFTEGEGENRVIQREFYGVTLQFGGTYKF